MSIQVKKLNAGYGDTRILWDISLQIASGELVALIGSNGAGKTTFLYTLAAVIPGWSGSVRLGETELMGLTADEVVRRGLALVPQGRRLFGGLSVKANLQLGAFSIAHQKDVEDRLAWVLDIFPRLKERQRQLAGTLSGGEQQMCALARGLMARPKLLCIDEMSLGLAPVIADQLMEKVAGLCREGLTVLLVEQDVESALSYATRAYIMEGGRITLEGTAAELYKNSSVREAYLGI